MGREQRAPAFSMFQPRLHANFVGVASPTALQRGMSTAGRFSLLVLAFYRAGTVPAALAADADSAAWAGGLKSSARLIAGAPADGVFQAGVEIRLAPGAITYWRNPGDAGLPPTLSFDGSSNLAQARTSFPAPRRLPEGSDEAFGYDGALILPIDVEPVEASRPVPLALKLNYAVCEKICVPAEANLRLVLPLEAAPSPYAEAIAKARALIPRRVDWTSVGADLTAASARTWRLCLASQEGPKRDLFIEPPESWWFDVKADAKAPAGSDCFRVTLMQQPPGSALPVAARLTITGGRGPVETTIDLKAGAGG